MMERIAFNNEECVIINSLCGGEMQEALTRSYLLGRLQNAKNILLSGKCPVEASELIDTDVIDEILRKLSAMEDVEWNDMKLLLPFPVVCGPEDEDFDLEEDGV